MQHTVSDFLCTTLVPELSTNITACSAGHIHFGLVTITTLRTFPDQFAIFLNNFIAIIKKRTNN